MKKDRVTPLLIVALLFIGGGTFLYSQKTTPADPATSSQSKTDEGYWVVYTTPDGKTEQWNPITNQKEVISIKRGDVLKESVRKEVQTKPAFQRKEGEKDYSIDFSNATIHYGVNYLDPESGSVFLKRTESYQIPSLNPAYEYSVLAWNQAKTEVYFTGYGELYSFNVETRVLQKLHTVSDHWQYTGSGYEEEPVPGVYYSASPDGSLIWIQPISGTSYKGSIAGITQQDSTLVIKTKTGILDKSQIGYPIYFSNRKLTSDDLLSEEEYNKESKEQHSAAKSSGAVSYQLPFVAGTQIKITRDGNAPKNGQTPGGPDGHSAVTYANEYPGFAPGGNSDAGSTTINDANGNPCHVSCNACSTGSESSPYQPNPNSSACQSCNSPCHNNRHKYGSTDMVPLAVSGVVKIPAIASGVVVRVVTDNCNAAGRNISVQTVEGTIYSIGHMSTITSGISVGMYVRQGDILGTMGGSGDFPNGGAGCSDYDPHIHVGALAPDEFRFMGQPAATLLESSTPYNGSTYIAYDGTGNLPSYIPRQNVKYTSQNTEKTFSSSFPIINPQLALDVNCGVEMTRNTEAGMYNLMKYGSDNCSGPELVYKVSVGGGQECKITFTDFEDDANNTIDLDCFVYQGENITANEVTKSVINSADAPQSLSFTNPSAQPRTYYIIVDGKDRRYGSFKLRVTGCVNAASCNDIYEPNNIPFYATTSRTLKQLSVLSDTKVFGNLRNRKGSVIIEGCIGDAEDADYYSWICIGKGQLTVTQTSYSGSAKTITLYNGSATNEIGSANSTQSIVTCKSTSTGTQYWIRVTGSSGAYKIALSWNGKSMCGGTGNRPESNTDEEQTTNSGFFVTPEVVTMCGDASTILISNGSEETQWFIDDEEGNAYLVHTGATLTYPPASTVIVYAVDPTDPTGESRQSVTINVSNPYNLIVTSTKGGEPQIQTGEQITLFASAGGTNLVYEWNTGQTTSSPTVSPLITTTYTVTVTDGNGCSDSEDIVVVVTTDPGGGGSANRYFKAIGLSGILAQYNQNQTISGTLSVDWGGYQSSGMLSTVRAYISHEFADGIQVPSNIADVQSPVSVMVDLQGGSGNTTLAFSGVIPNLASGQYYLVVRCNSNLESMDPFRPDNYLSTPITIGAVPPSGHNFAVQCDNVTPAAGSTVDIHPGSSLNMAMVVYNWGAISDGVTCGVYLSHDNVWGPGDKLLDQNTWQHINAGAGLQHMFTNLYLDPADITSTGTWYLIAVADPFGQYAETNEADNICALPFGVQSLSPTAPNLELLYPIVVRQGTTVYNWYPGQPAIQLLAFNPNQGNDDNYVLVSYRYRNGGNTSISENFNSWQNRCFLSPEADIVFDGDHPDYDDFNIGVVPTTSGQMWPGEERLINDDRLLNFLGFENGHILIDLNYQRMNEMNYSDNSVFVPIILVASPLARSSDIAVRIDSLYPTTIQMGDTLTVISTVANHGPDTISNGATLWKYFGQSYNQTALAPWNGQQPFAPISSTVLFGSSYAAPGDSVTVIDKYLVVNTGIGLQYFTMQYDAEYYANDLNRSNNISSAAVSVVGDNCYGYLIPFPGAQYSTDGDTLPWQGGLIGPFNIRGVPNCQYRFSFRGLDPYQGSSLGITNSATISIGYNSYVIPHVFDNRSHSGRTIEIWGGVIGGEKLLYKIYQEGRPCGNERALEYAAMHWVNDWSPTVKLFLNQYALAPQGSVPYWYTDTLGSAPVAVADTLIAAPDSSTTYWFRFYSEVCGFGAWHPMIVNSSKMNWYSVWGSDGDVVSVLCDSSYTPKLNDMLWRSKTFDASWATVIPDRYQVVALSNQIDVVIYSGYEPGLTIDTLRAYRTIVKIDTLVPQWQGSLPPDTILLTVYDTLPQYSLLAVDNCGQVSIGYSEESDTVIGLITTYRTWSACDDFGNCNYYTQIVFLQTISLQKLVTQPLCSGDSGFVWLLPQNAVPPVNYLWGDGVVTAARFVFGGVYMVTITDSRGAVMIDTSVIVQPPLLGASLSSNAIACNQWQMVLHADGGTPPYQYDWTNGGNDSVTVISAGWMSVEIMDSHGCHTWYDSIFLDPMTAVIVESVEVDADSCGIGVGTIRLVIPEQHTVVWGTGETIDTLLGVLSGIYSATIVGENGCDTVISVVVPHVNCDTTASAVIVIPSDLLLEVFPNPTRGVCVVRSEQCISQLEVFDQLGRLATVQSNDSNMAIIDLSEFPDGVYFVKIYIKNTSLAVAKVVKE